MININGMQHVVLTVSQFEVARTFYKRLLPALGLKLVFDGEDYFYHVGARTAVGVQPCAPEYAGERFVQLRIGLHHFCFRARSRKDVDATHELLLEMNAHVVTPPGDGGWVPGYYYVLFEDPDGIRLEVAFVPNKGVLAESVEFNPGQNFKRKP